MQCFFVVLFSVILGLVAAVPMDEQVYTGSLQKSETFQPEIVLLGEKVHKNITTCVVTAVTETIICFKVKYKSNKSSDIAKCILEMLVDFGKCVVIGTEQTAMNTAGMYHTTA